MPQGRAWEVGEGASEVGEGASEVRKCSPQVDTKSDEATGSIPSWTHGMSLSSQSMYLPGSLG